MGSASSQSSLAPTGVNGPATIPAWMRPGAFSDPDRAVVNQDRMHAAQRHRSPPRPMPARTCGISSNPLGSFPTVQISATSAGQGSRTLSQAVWRPRGQHSQLAGPSGSSRLHSFDINLLVIVHPEPVGFSMNFD